MKRFPWVLSVLTVMWVRMVCPAGAAEVITARETFHVEQLEVVPSGEASVLRLKNGFYPCRPGCPEVPAVNRLHELPPGCDAAAVEVVSAVWTPLEAPLMVRPQPAPRRFSCASNHATPVQEAIYTSDAWFPESPVTLSGPFLENGRRVACVTLHPVRYRPASRRVEMLADIEYRIVLEPVPSPSVKKHALRGEATDVEYLIVTTEQLEPEFEPLAQWKNQKGVPAAVVCIDDILEGSDGRDDAEKLRNYIRNLWMNGALKYVLLAGYHTKMPVRIAFAMDCEVGSNDIPCDLYYSDLDGAWDADGDGVFGEIADAVDMMPDVLVGRVPVKTGEQAAGFVAKVLSYERNPPEDYVPSALFLADVLWEDPYTDSSVHKELIGDTCFPPTFHIDKLYKSQGTETVASVFLALNGGGHLLNHDGHGSEFGWGAGDGFLNISAVRLLQNVTRPWVIYSTGCLTANFQWTCIAGEFVVNPSGGAVAYIGNANYGWGLPGNPGFGYSDVFDTRFFHLLFNSRSMHIGELFADSKAYFVAQAQEENVYRWIEYSLNFLGDPEMPVWTDTPRELHVSAPDSVSAAGDIPVWVAPAEDLSGAVACLYRENECQSVAAIDAEGFARLPLPDMVTGPVTLTVTAQNFIPFQKEIVLDDRPDIRIHALNINDSAADSCTPGVAEPGEQLQISPEIINLGAVTAHDVTGELHPLDPGVTVDIDTANYGNVSGHESALPALPFILTVDAGITDTSLSMELLLRYDGVEQRVRFNLFIGFPILEPEQFIIYDFAPGGDEDGLLEPGESAYVVLVLKNSGTVTACRPVVEVSPGGTVTPASSRLAFPSISPGESSCAFQRVQVTLDAQAEPGVAVELPCVCTANGLSFDFTLALPVGTVGFSDDFESCGDRWETPGDGNLWHCTDYRTASGNAAFYCGHESTRRYDTDMECCLVSPEFFAPEDATLMFQRWFDFPIYGADGVFVEILDGESWVPLTFLGGGGSLNLSSDWMLEAVPLPVSNRKTRVRFRAVAEGLTVAEGFYLDDVSVSGGSGGDWHSEPELPGDKPPACDTDGIQLLMPRTFFASGDTVFLDAWVCNARENPRNFDLYVCLDVFGTYYFLPEFSSEPRSKSVAAFPGSTHIEIIAPFTWPDAEPGTGLLFYAALTDAETFQLVGNISVWEFGWSN